MGGWARMGGSIKPGCVVLAPGKRGPSRVTKCWLRANVTAASCAAGSNILVWNQGQGPQSVLAGLRWWELGQPHLPPGLYEQVQVLSKFASNGTQ